VLVQAEVMVLTGTESDIAMHREEDATDVPAMAASESHPRGSQGTRHLPAWDARPTCRTLDAMVRQAPKVARSASGVYTSASRRNSKSRWTSTS